MSDLPARFAPPGQARRRALWLLLIVIVGLAASLLFLNTRSEPEPAAPAQTPVEPAPATIQEADKDSEPAADAPKPETRPETQQTSVEPAAAPQTAVKLAPEPDPEPEYDLGDQPWVGPGDPDSYNPELFNEDGSPKVGPDGRPYYQLDDILQPPPPPTMTIIPPKEDEFSSQTAAGTPQVVRAITDKSIYNTNFQAYYPLTGTIVDPDGQTLSWNVIKPAEADWLVFDLAALTLSGRVPSSFAEGDSITITVKAIDTDAKAAEYSFSITSLGPYNPEPLGCRATGAPIATKSWIKIGNWEWAEPNHNPAIPQNTPGYWQPDWVENLGGVGKPKWSAPYIIKPSRRVAGQAERWRMKEVEYYRITRSPAWDFGQLIVDIDDLQRFYGPDGNEVAITVVKGRDIAPTSTDPRTDGLWTYTLTDYEQESTEPGYIYTVEASTCAEGPWSQGLEQQWRLPFAPKIHEHRTRLTNLDEDGYLLPNGQLALKIGWAFERGEVYNIDIEVSDPDNPGDFLKGVGRSLPHTQSDLSGGQWQVLIERAYIPDADAFHNLDGSGRQVRVRMRVLIKPATASQIEGPWSDWLYLTASEE